MTTGQDLKQIVMLNYFTDAMLDNLARIVDVLKFDRDEFIFREQQPSKRFYMLKSGLVLLEQRISEHVTAYVSSVKPGYSFGWSAMLENETYEFDAVCKEPCEVYSFKAGRIQNLFQEDPEMGLRMYRRLMVIIKKRLDIRTEQFQKAIMHHPDMKNLF